MADRQIGVHRLSGTITDYYNPYSPKISVSALHERTGAVLWSRETIRRGLNDYENAGS